MLSLKVCIFLALSIAHSVHSQDDFEWLPCLQKALAEGIPSLNFPSKDPWKFSHSWEYSFTVDYNVIDIIFDVNFTCGNVPWWTVTNYTVLDNSDKYVEAAYSLQWKNVSVFGNIISIVTENTELSESDGNFSFVLDEINWNGRVTLNKATETSLQYLNDLTARWENEKDVEAHIVTGDVDTIADVTDIFNQFLLNLSEDNKLGETVRVYLNDNWLRNTINYQALMEYCQNS